MARDTGDSGKYTKCMGLAGQGNMQIREARGYAMAALLVGLSVMAVLMTAALPVWSHWAKREREEEWIWRAKQYARAIVLFQRSGKFGANTFPPSFDFLVEQRFLRRKYKDPITGDDFQPLFAGNRTPGQPGAPGQPGQPGPLGPPIQPGQQAQATAAGLIGVTSKSKDSSIKIFNGRQKYNEWAVTVAEMQQAMGAVAGGPNSGAFPGAPGQPGQPLPPGMQNPFAPPGGRGGFPGGPGSPGGRGFPGGPPPGGGFQMMPPQSTLPPVPFGQPGQAPFGQPGQSPFVVQPGQSPFGQPPGGRGPVPFKPPG